MVAENNSINNKCNVVSNGLDSNEEENLFEWEIDEELEVTHETTLNP